jgi:PAS domain S-box-containing protein
LGPQRDPGWRKQKNASVGNGHRASGIFELAPTLTKKVLILVAIPVVFELALVGVLLNLIANVQDARAKSAHARELSSHITALMANFIRRATLVALRRMMSDQEMTNSEKALAAKARTEMEIIKQLASSEKSEAQKWAELEKTGYYLDAEFAATQEINFEEDQLKAAKTIALANKNFNRMFAICDQLSGMQNNLQAENQAYFEKYDTQLKQVIELSLLASVVLACCLTAYFNISTSRRLKILMANTTALAAGKAPDKIVSGNDELAEIDLIYHQMYQDLTVLRQKERAILDNASQVICSLDKDLRLSDINDASNKMWGFPPSQLIGKRLLDLIQDQDKSTVRNILQNAIQNKTEARFEAKIVKADKSLSETSWSATWSDEQSSLYCVVTDISKQKELERLKQEFVSMLSHDLRTPLNSVLAAIELVSSGHFTLDDQVKVYMDRAHRNLKFSLSLINQLLEIEKMEAGHVSLEVDATSTKEIVSKSLEAVLDLSNAKSIKIVIPETNYELIADSERLVQVLINFLGNALKFSPDNSTITISEEQNDLYTKISVTDQGRGIPADQQAGIFDRFKQVSPTDKVEKQGSGLGLAICKSIIEAHHGRIGVSSEPGRGSSFWFEIPVKN